MLAWLLIRLYLFKILEYGLSRFWVTNIDFRVDSYKCKLQLDLPNISNIFYIIKFNFKSYLISSFEQEKSRIFKYVDWKFWFICKFIGSVRTCELSELHKFFNYLENNIQWRWLNKKLKWKNLQNRSKYVLKLLCSKPQYYSFVTLFFFLQVTLPFKCSNFLHQKS